VFLGVAPVPGRETVYAYLQIGGLNAWTILVWWWPEIGLALLAVPTLIASRWLILPPRSSGPLYCRRCHYPLAPGIGPRCPECGLALTPRNCVPERPARWKLLVPVAVLALLSGGYVMFRSMLPRYGFVSEWFRWPSSALHDWAWQRGMWDLCNTHKVFDYRLVELDLGQGRVVDTVVSRADAHQLWNGMVVSGDGATIAIIEGGQIIVVDAGSGRVRRTIELPETGRSPGQSFFYQAALSHDGTELYAAGWQHSLYKWDVARGTLLDEAALEDLVELEALAGAVVRRLEPAPGGGLLAGIDCYLIGSNEAILLAINEDLRAALVKSRAPAAAMPWMAVTRDGSRWYGLETDGDLVVGAAGQAEVERHLLPGRASWAMRLSPDGRRLAVGRIDDAGYFTEILDAATLEPLVRLGPRDLAAGGYAFDLPGGRFAASGYRTTPAGATGVLAVYDLGGSLRRGGDTN
jgi:hypothetical protein